MSLKISVEPVLEPVNIGECKDWNRIDTTDHDTLLRGLIKAARREVEQFLSRALISQTWVLKFDSFPYEIRPPLPPLQSITSIAYNDVDGNSQTVDSADYTVDTNSEPGRIVEAVNASWPATEGHIDDVTVTYVAGYGDDPGDVPWQIRNAIKMLVGYYYDTPQPLQWDVNAVVKLRAAAALTPEHIWRSIASYRMYWRGEIGV